MTRITYLRNYDGLPVVCLVFNHEKDSKTLTYQMAVHHPKDRCSKKIAVATASERLKDNPIELTVPSDLDDFDFRISTLCTIAIVRDIIAREKSVPRRAVKVAQMWNPPTDDGALPPMKPGLW